MSRARSSPARRIAAKILARVEQEGAWAEQLLNASFRRGSMNPNDRGLCTELVYGTLRQQIRLDFALRPFLQRSMAKQPLHLRLNLRLAAYQLLHTRIPMHAAVNEAVGLVREQTPRLAGLCNAVLRRFSEALDADALAQPEDLATRHAHPPWMVEQLAECPLLQLEGEMEAYLQANNRRPQTHLRLNRLLTKDWPRHGDDSSAPQALATPLAGHASLEDGVRLAPGAGGITSLPGYLAGHFVVQDLGAQMVGLLADPRAGELVVDLCAAPGGKTTHLAELLLRANTAAGRDGGQVVAVDRHQGKSMLIRDNASRLRLSNIRVVVGDVGQDDTRAAILRIAGQAEEPPEGAAEPGFADLVVLDAPCSGTGTLARNPELRHRHRTAQQAQQQLDELHTVQTGLLRQAARMVKRGGRLIYSVCSVLPSEAELLIGEFLRQHNDAFVIEAPGEICAQLRPYQSEQTIAGQPAACLRTWPHRHGTDGFFAVSLRRAL